MNEMNFRDAQRNDGSKGEELNTHVYRGQGEEAQRGGGRSIPYRICEVAT